MHNNSYLELDPKAYKTNIDFLRKHFHKGVLFSSVVKGNAYGHSIEKFVEIALAENVKHFSVFDSQEARRVKAVVGDKATVMIMGWLSNEEDLNWIIQNDIEFFVFEKHRLTAALTSAKKIGKKAIVHIEVETGMNRTGFNSSELKWVQDFLNKNSSFIEFKGLCTHFAGAESIANYFRIKKQIERYDEIYKQFCDKGLKPKQRHAACSAAAMMYPETQMDMVRIGIMQYGFWPSPEVLVNFYNSKRKNENPLKRVISWKTQVMSVKKVKRGEFVGYGTSFMADANMKIACVPVGYAHGYGRSLSNVGRVLINGERCVVIGSINMNMMVVDVTLLEHIKRGDEVVLIGDQADKQLSVSSFSDYSNLLNYELLTRLSADIPRIIKK
ncbi:alanine racemase [Chryseobacterium sp. SNU WT5]|uniref:alanine racemase n=1 Tax=Chryseobacterium sp. SNU WT5 TaxID=2594269 RepID=UPI0011809751|nr:alanine racemase [Chryseobacterium sp. SNU WT5]QDP84159.1 alanine racemase [Chryseobacterium sp. SNU WT5]